MAIIGDLTSRRGQVTGQEPRGNAIAINAFVPLANMFGYINTLRSMSSGRAQFTMQFDHYEPVPQNISEEIQSEIRMTGRRGEPRPTHQTVGRDNPATRKRRPSWQRQSLNVTSRM